MVSQFAKFAGSIMAIEKVTLVIDTASWNLIIEALGTLPFNRVNPLIVDLVNQVNSQVRPEEIQKVPEPLPEKTERVDE